MSTYLPLLIEMVMATRYILRISVRLGLVLSHPSRWLLISRKCLPLNCYCLINIVGLLPPSSKYTEPYVLILITATVGIL